MAHIEAHSAVKLVGPKRVQVYFFANGEVYMGPGLTLVYR
jgi:hypothetical protein